MTNQQIEEKEQYAGLIFTKARYSCTQLNLFDP